METLEQYLQRKSQEIDLLSGCLNAPLNLKFPNSPAEVIGQKFQIASALKAEYAIQDWALTETAWAHPGKMRAGPFEFSYDYQRADLEVKGPPFYAFRSSDSHDTIYTSSGMSSISALLFATARVMPPADILVLPGSYGETLELIEMHTRHLKIVQLAQPAKDIGEAGAENRLLLLDTSTPSDGIEAIINCDAPRISLVIFDTTCFSSGSGRIARVLSWTRRCGLPTVLVRSHTKLDSLGVEYGRLGSAVFVDAKDQTDSRGRNFLQILATETRQAVRLFGGAALPAHFPPFAGSQDYRRLTNRRAAAILRNGRRTTRYFGKALARSAGQLNYAHGLYLTLAPKQPIDEDRARDLADQLSTDLSKAGLPVRHAGSFGFDFAATEWFHDALSDRFMIRVAVPDLPTLLWDDMSTAIAGWWSSRDL
jgi:hypothetical protein